MKWLPGMVTGGEDVLLNPNNQFENMLRLFTDGMREYRLAN